MDEDRLQAAFVVGVNEHAQEKALTYLRDAGIINDETPIERINEFLGAWNIPPVVATKTGKIMTDADFEALADEAEHGYDITHLVSPDMDDEIVDAEIIED